jgi:hypothetical protein
MYVCISSVCRGCVFSSKWSESAGKIRVVCSKGMYVYKSLAKEQASKREFPIFMQSDRVFYPLLRRLQERTTCYRNRVQDELHITSQIISFMFQSTSNVPTQK